MNGRKTEIEYILKPFKTVRKAKAYEMRRTDLSFCDVPAPEIVFDGRSFCLTGIFEFAGGDRDQCEAAIRARGGICMQHPTHDLDYLVIGTFVERSWAHNGYGRKIEKALDFRRFGAKAKIVSEAHWVQEIQVKPALSEEKQVKVQNQGRSDQLKRLQGELDEIQRLHKALLQVLHEELDVDAVSRVMQKFKQISEWRR